MEHYTIMTLKGGENQLTFDTKVELLETIEELSGINIPDQRYYINGSLEELDTILNSRQKYFQVVSSNESSLRYFINTPQGKLKVYVSPPLNRTVEDLIQSILYMFSINGLPYSMKEYSFSVDNKTLQLGQSIKDIPNGHEVDLCERPVYSKKFDNYLYVQTLTGKTFICFFEPKEKVSEFKLKVFQVTRIKVDDLRLIFRGTPLEDEKCLSDYNIEKNSTIHLVPKLKGRGNLVSSGSFYMSLDLKIYLTDTAPRWRLIKEGISWTGLCINLKCEALLEEVICNYGFGVFDIQTAKDSATCPICSKCLINIGFYCCRYKFYGIETTGCIREGSGEAVDKNYKFF